jgi:molybdopterin molybdotransferase
VTVTAETAGVVAGPVKPGLSWRDAYGLATRVATPLPRTRLPVGVATGLVLADPVCAPGPAPAFDTAAMDGFAVAGAGPWRVVGRVLAGHPGTQPLVAGCAVEIATGAIVPAGATAVLPYEQSQRTGDRVSGRPGDSDHIRRTGDDMRTGDELMAAGRVLTATAVSALTQAGAPDVWVHRAPRVAVYVTGDEVVRHEAPALGQVRDAFGPLVTALVTRAGGTVVHDEVLGDDRELLRAAIAGCQDVDVVVVTGSSSVGVADHLRSVLRAEELCRHVDGVRCRPGRPQTLTRLRDGRWLVGLPGNPFAGLVAGLTLLEPVVTALSGRRPAPLAALPVAAGTHPVPGLTRLVPVRVDGATATAVPGARAGNLRAVASADAIAVLEPQWTDGAVADLLAVP